MSDMNQPVCDSAPSTRHFDMYPSVQFDADEARLAGRFDSHLSSMLFDAPSLPRLVP